MKKDYKNKAAKTGETKEKSEDDKKKSGPVERTFVVPGHKPKLIIKAKNREEANEKIKKALEGKGDK